VTFDQTLDTSGVWSPDGKRVALRKAEKGIVSVDATGTGNPEVLLETGGNPMSWSPDGRFLLFAQQTKLGLLDIAAKKVTLVGSSNGASGNGKFSPDGKYIAYSSNDTGRSEVFVQPVPPGTGRTQISVKGGSTPRWNRNGKELFFISPEGMLMVADVTLGATFSVGAPRALFEMPSRMYDVSRDGQRVLIVAEPKEIEAPITVVMNWWLGL